MGARVEQMPGLRETGTSVRSWGCSREGLIASMGGTRRCDGLIIKWAGFPRWKEVGRD